MHSIAVLAATIGLWAALAAGQPGQACAQAKTCQACFVRPSCGWCVSNGECMAGGQMGPDAAGACRGVKSSGGILTLRERQLWYYSNSQVLATTPGFPVNPVTASVYLKPNEAANVEVQVTAPLPTDQDLDIMFVQDTSGSMADDIQIFRTLATSLVNAVLKLSKTAKTGLASFIEKPVFPQGFPPGDDKYQLADGSVRNYAYRLEAPLRSSSLSLQKALFRLDATSNRDLPEAAFEALSQVLTCPNIGWRAEARKIIVLTTDAKFHSANDPADWVQNGVTNKPAWNGQCYGAEEGKKYLREKNNYPSKAQIAQLFKAKNIIPIFAVAHNPRDPTLPVEEAFWRQFQQTQIGFGATVKLSDNSDNLIDLIVKALSSFNQEIALVITTDNKKVITGLRNKANKQGSIQAGAKYSGVAAGTTVTFVLTLNTAQQIPKETLTLTSPGFGSVLIDVTTLFPCKDCAKVDNGAAKWDACDECGGRGACVGCDGKAFSGKVYDMCGVCGGANQCKVTCTNAALKVDQCGVCGGQNLCLGCDGVPNSLAVLDQCDVCGGQNDCIGCDGIKNGKKLDLCGVCGGNNECVGCDGTPTLVGQKKIYDQCGVCGGSNECRCDTGDDTKIKDQCDYCGKPGDGLFNSCLGCDGVSDSGLIYDLCGVCGGNNECVSDCDGEPFGVRRDLCGVCGGNSSGCVVFDGVQGMMQRQVAEGADAENDEGSIVAVAVAVPLALLICAALVVAFFIYKSRADPEWLLPAGMRSNMASGLADNPLYDGSNGWQQNAIAND